MEFQAARRNMLTQQIRARDVLDQRLLDVIASTPREDFVPDPLRRLAFADERLPIGHGQYMMAPSEESLMLQALNITDRESILEVGTGTGYVTALLAKLGKYVFSIDIFDDFTQKAAVCLSKLALHNLTLHTGDAILGWDKHAPYDVICMTGSLPECSLQLREQLTVGGRMFVVLGKKDLMQATLIHRVSVETWQERVLFETNLPPLLNAIAKETFTF